MPEHPLVADWTDPEALERLSERLREWEPQLDLYRPPRDARLFEPDGTLYAFCLGGAMTVTYGHRERSVARGDALVVPRGIPLDIEPAVELLGLRYDGPAPDHFRERFIQIWGYEHLPAPSGGGPAGRVEVIPQAELRHRVPYSLWEGDGAVELVGGSGLDHLLFFGLDGLAELQLATTSPSSPLPPGRVAAVEPGEEYRLRGRGRVGILVLSSEPVHVGRRREWLGGGGALSPEYGATSP